MKWQHLTEKMNYTNIDGIPKEYRDIVINSLNYPYIFRGMQNTGPYIIGDGTGSSRVSRNTTNHYTVLIDEILPDWKNYPDRSKSFICSTDSGTAHGHGTLYIAIPLENQNIGVCSDTDFWVSFPMVQEYLGIRSLNVFNETINELTFKTIGRTLATTKDGMLKDFNDLQAYIDNNQDDFEKIDWEDAIFKTQITRMFKFFTREGVKAGIADVFNPKYNGFRIEKPSTLNEDDREVWMSGKVLFIREAEHEEFMLSVTDD